MPRRSWNLLFLLGLVAVMGCARSPLRNLKWWPARPSGANSVASDERPVSQSDNAQLVQEATDFAPAKLPPGIELPPAPARAAETLPSGATQPIQNESSSSVIFASATNRPR